MRPVIRDIHELIAHYKAGSSGHFFAPDTMRFFQSRILGPIFHGEDGLIFFCTSERPWSHCDPRPTTRRYTVRVYNPVSHSIAEPEDGGFRKYNTGRAAIRAAEGLAKNPEAWTYRYATRAQVAAGLEV